MNFHLAQLNIAKFHKPKDHPDNLGFVENLDRINAIAESSPGFVWRLVGEADNAIDIDAFDDPFTITNLSVWRDLDSLAGFAYRNPEHRAIMRRRHQWFEPLEINLVLWWIEEGHVPKVEEAVARLDALKQHGPSENAFTFKASYPAPD